MTSIMTISPSGAMLSKNSHTKSRNGVWETAFGHMGRCGIGQLAVDLAETLRRDEHVVVVAQLHVRRRKSRLLGLVRDSPHPEVKVPLVAAQVHDVLHHAEGVLVAVDGVDFHRGQLPVELPAERDEESQKLAARAAADYLST